MSSNASDEDLRSYIVLVNIEEQYSLWLAHQAVPAGWKVVSGPAPKAECLDYVKRNWTDMTPLSVRQKAAARAQSKESPPSH
jgi:MbtH protein